MRNSVRYAVLLYVRRRYGSYPLIASRIRGKTALEIGGPTRVLCDGPLPIYRLLDRLDSVDFSEKTIWSADGKKNQTEPGLKSRRYICEGSDLKEIKDGSYDLVINSHVIEHLSNPLKALLEWIRVLRQGGLLLMVVPHKQFTFDHARPTTTLDHMVKDYENDIPEGDTSHLDLDEVFEHYDISLDPGVKTKEEFIARTKLNRENRALHQHVFTTESAIALVDYAGFRLISVEAELPFNIVILAQKAEGGGNKVHEANRALYAADAKWRRRSPFKDDKKCL